MPPYKAGQYLSFNFKKGTIEGVIDHDVKRNWSISCGENQDSFRISVKKEDKGLVSTYMHEKVMIGDVLEVCRDHFTNRAPIQFKRYWYSG